MIKKEVLMKTIETIGKDDELDVCLESLCKRAAVFNYRCFRQDMINNGTYADTIEARTKDPLDIIIIMEENSDKLEYSKERFKKSLFKVNRICKETTGDSMFTEKFDKTNMDILGLIANEIIGPELGIAHYYGVH